MLVGLAVGVDYAMFYLRRMMEERDKGRSSDVALDIAAATSGRAVLISGFTVMAAMGGMFFSGNPIFVSFGIGTILVVGVAVVGSLTFLPAVLSYLGQKNWLEKGRVPWVAKRRHSTNGESRVWSAILDRVLARPLVSAILAGGMLVALSVPALGMQFKEPGTEGMSRSQPIIQTLDRIDAAFPGGSVPATVIVKAADVTTPEVQGAIQDLHDEAIATGQLHEPVGIEISPDKKVAIVALSIDGKGTDEASNRSIEVLREQVVPATVGQLDGVEVAVSGGTAWSKDFLDTMKSHLPIVFGFVLSLAFILLLVTFRSIVIPIKAIVLNLLSVGAAYGILTLVFQDGHGEKLLGFTSVGGIAPWLPLFLFVILFGLSMDYHVFVLSRIREAVDRGMSTDKAVAHGIKSHGRRHHQRRGRDGRHLRDVRHGRRPVHEAARRRPGGGDPDRRHAGPRGAPARDDEAPGQAQLVPAQGPGLAAEVRARARGGARRRLILPGSPTPVPEPRRPPSRRAPVLLGPLRLQHGVEEADDARHPLRGREAPRVPRALDDAVGDVRAHGRQRGGEPAGLLARHRAVPVAVLEEERRELAARLDVGERARLPHPVRNGPDRGAHPARLGRAGVVVGPEHRPAVLVGAVLVVHREEVDGREPRDHGLHRARLARRCPAPGRRTADVAAVTPSMQARCPPAEAPKAPKRPASSPSVAAFARRKRTAALTSWTAAGKGASPERR